LIDRLSNVRTERKDDWQSLKRARTASDTNDMARPRRAAGDLPNHHHPAAGRKEASKLIVILAAPSSPFYTAALC
jgi:hypothetical protein